MVVAVIGEDSDLTADRLLLRARERLMRATRLNVDRLSESGLTTSCEPGRSGRCELLVGGEPITGVWCRTTTFIPPTRPAVFGTADFIRLQWALALHAVEGQAGNGVCWMNAPSKLAIASNKAHQLNLCDRLGLAVPETLLSNQPSAIRRFARGKDKIIMKALRSGSFILNGQARTAYSTLVDSSMLEFETHLDEFPALFQRYIEGIDIRVCVVGSQVISFRSQIDNDCRISPDWRAVAGVRWALTELPDKIIDQLKQLVSELHLAFAAIDLVHDVSESNYYFLEINPAGQWAFLEGESFCVTDAILDLLGSSGEMTC